MPWCKPCERGFGSTHDYHKHLSTSFAHCQYVCRYCPRRFPSSLARNNHEQNDNYQCSDCNKRFCSAQLRDQHHQNDRFECSFCDRRFCSSRLLDEHHRTDDYVCFSCTVVFCSEDLLERHLSENYIECTFCAEPFCSAKEHDRHLEHASDHPYCVPCKRGFKNMNNLRMHQRGRAHDAESIQCQFCDLSYTTASGLFIHLESGNCSSDFTHEKINAEVRRHDQNRRITRSRPKSLRPEIEFFSSDESWNGTAYECFLCERTFPQLYQLYQHTNSPAHQEKLYQCPNPKCEREYRTFSGLVQHVESHSCGFMCFHQVQKATNLGFPNLVRRLIRD